LNTTAIALRSSAGNHRLHPGIGGWVQHCDNRTKIQHCWMGRVDGALNNQLVPEGVMRSSLLRTSASYGLLLGVEPTKIGFSIGPTIQFLNGGVDGSVLLLQPGGVGQISIQKPVSDEWLMVIGNGYTIRGWSVDADLTIGLGRRW
jgi:hypothetical protein